MRAEAADGGVAVVVPCYRAELTPDERVSLLHLNSFLSSYDRYLVMPKSLRFGLDGFGVERFGDRWFESRRSYSALLLTTDFYRRFSRYDYILLYQLDSLVFSDQLRYWCGKNHDYIGAVHTIEGRVLVGNGGFSLRRVGSFLNVLTSKRRTSDPREHWQRNWATAPRVDRWRKLPRRYLKHLHAFNGVQWEIRRLNRAYSGWSEDWFWSLQARKYWPSFRIAPNEDGLHFAFCEEPRESFELIGRQLPFGCHGWTRFDREFWRPFLLAD